jgi:ATP-dependent RNA helicase MSS116
LGFLLPTIQNILRQDPQLAHRQRYSRARPSDIRAIIISPTRELAEQIAVEADKLCYNTDLRVQVAVGGNSKRMMLSKMQREGCHLLVATPGRLNDLLTDQYSRVEAPKLTTLVLDEADRLLDDGFSKDIEDIIELLPNRNVVDRQTLLFSATVPREVMHLVRRTLKPDFHFVQTVQENEPATHEKVPQHLVAVPGIENFMPSLLELCKREIEAASRAHASGAEVKPFKAIVYFSSTANVELAAQVFESLRGETGGFFGQHPLYPAEISEMHGQLNQQQRTRVSERFRRAKSAILFSTDVTARGMDFPNVSHVIQIGLPPNRDQYIHRIGRTGRGDKTGEGWIFIAETELPEARRRLRGLPISANKTLEASKVDMTRDAQLPAPLAATLSQVGAAIKLVDRETKTKAYMAALGQAGGQGKDNVVMLNQWTRYGWGWEQPPAINTRLAQKLGISKVQGVNLQGRDRDRSFEDAVDELNGPPRERAGRLDRGGFGGRGGFGDRDGGRDRGFGGRGGFGDRNGGRDRGFGGDRGGSGGRGGGGRDFGNGRRDDGGGFSRGGSKDYSSNF